MVRLSAPPGSLGDIFMVIELSRRYEPLHQQPAYPFRECMGTMPTYLVRSPPTARRPSRHPLHSGGPRGVHRHPLGVVSGLQRSLPPLGRYLETLPVGSL